MRWFLGFLACLLLPLCSLAATRVGLHITQEEIWCIRQRIAVDSQGSHGITCPVKYKSAGDVRTNSPGDWDHILANANTMKGNANSQRWDATDIPTKGGGPLTHGGFNTCVNPCQSSPCTMPGSNRLLGDNPRDAGFVAMILNDTSYITNVKAYLLYEAARPNLAFGNTQVWCTGQVDGQNSVWDTNDFFDINNYIVKLFYAYDYIRPFLLPSGAVPDASAVSTLDQWFLDAGTMGDNVVDFQVGSQFSASRTDNLSNFTVAGGVSTASVKRCYCNGVHTTGFANKWNNRMATFPHLAAMAGVMFNNTHLKTMGKRYFMEHIQFAVFADGTPSEFERGVGNPGDTGGWKYSIGTTHMVGMIADMLARTGDTSLYDYSTSNGFGSGNTDTRGGPKTLQLLISQLAKYVNQTETGSPRYALNADTNCNTGGLIDASGSNRDTYLAQMNMYYQDTSGSNNIQSEYMRTASSAPGYPASPEGGGYYVWGGVSGILPGALLQFGQMEGVVDPFTLSSSSPPSLAITAPTSSPTYSTGATPLTTLAGTATDDVGVTSVTWACPTCTPTSGTATCATCGSSATAPSWSVASIGLSSGANVITVTANDADTQTGTDTLTVTYTPASAVEAPTILRVVR